MADPLLLFGTKRMSLVRMTLLFQLISLGLKASQGVSPSERAVNILVLDIDTTSEELFEDLPWLKEQFDYSSLRGFRLMPVLVFDSRKDDVENLGDKPIATTLEEVISGEFKPYGYDLAKKNPLEEFLSVLEGYEE